MNKKKMNPVLRNVLICGVACLGIAVLVIIAFFGSVVIGLIKSIPTGYIITAVISSVITAVVCGIVESFGSFGNKAESSDDGGKPKRRK